MSSAWGASWGSAWGDAWGPLAAVVQPPKPDFIPGGRLLPGKRSHLRGQAKADTRLVLRCAVQSSARLSIPAAAAVDAPTVLESSARLALSASSEVAAQPALIATAQAHDVVLEMLLLTD